MTILIPKHQRGLIINEYLRLAQAYIFRNVSPSDRERIVTHINWMRAQEDDLLVACRFETSTDRRVTSIYFEASFLHQKRET